MKGRVGLVEEGRTLGSPQTRMMSGAWPPPAPSVWKVWMVRPAKAAMLCSAQPDSLRVSVWMATCTSSRSATARQVSMAAGVVPQSSCSFSPMHPAPSCSASPSGRAALPLPRSPTFTGNASSAWSMSWALRTPGVQVVALVPVAGPVPPPTMVVTPLATASSACCGLMKWMWLSMPPAVRMRPSPAMHSVPGPTTMPGVTPAMTSGLPALPMPAMRPPFTPTSALKMPV